MGTDIRLEEAFVSMITTVSISDEILARIQNDVAADAEYGATLRAYDASFPAEKRADCGDYWPARNEYASEDGLLYYQGRIVVPRPARARVVEALHRGHVAVSTMVKRAKDTVWWPSMLPELKKRAQQCGECQEELPMQMREPMQSFEIPAAPGLVVHADNFELAAKEYLILADGFSGWTEVFTSSSRRPAEVMRLLRTYMARNGVPRQFHSDQGAAFMSAEFRAFCQKWGIKATEASAKHPRGNAIAEAAVKKVKKILCMAMSEDELTKALLAMHQTPVAPGRPSPAQLHFGRNVRDDLHPRVTAAHISWQEVREWKEAVALERKHTYDRGTRALRGLWEGEVVLVHQGGRWERAKVLRSLPRPRSYLVQVLRTGQRLERNRHLLREIDQESKLPSIKRVCPSPFFQPREPRAPIQVLMMPGGVVGAASTAPPPARTPGPSTPQDRRLSTLTSSSGSPAETDTTPVRSPALSASPGTPTRSESSQSSRSRSTEQTATDDEEASDDHDEWSSPVARTPPLHITRAGRHVRQPDRYSPS